MLIINLLKDHPRLFLFTLKGKVRNLFFVREGKNLIFVVVPTKPEATPDRFKGSINHPCRLKEGDGHPYGSINHPERHINYKL